MSEEMVVRVEDLTPGMALALPIVDMRGRLLAGAGMRVTAALRRRMWLWGVRVVAVRPGGLGEPRVYVAPPTRLRQTPGFAPNEADPFMRELARLAARRADEEVVA